ncbi:VOC family protein [Actinomadura viridis]|uniref:VOC family protein n=1 Tax=Actinomadura viridis TaxID=58110 RepID=UPI003690CCE6
MTPAGALDAVLDHVATEETDIDARVAFHVGVLGFRVLRWGAHVETGGRIAMLGRGGGAKIELIEVGAPRGDLAHIGYRVPDVRAAHARLLDAGCVEDRAPFRLDAAMADTSFVRDPSGGRLQLITYAPGSPDL